MRQKQNKNRCGFSLIEGIVAMFVLSVGVLAVSQLFSSTATQSKENGRYISAMALAQEGTELFRAFRNDNLVRGDDGFKDIAAGRYRVQMNNTALPSFGAYSDVDGAKLAVASDGGLYQHNVVSSLSSYPVFWRVVYVNDAQVNGSDARKITSVVYFRQPNSFPNEDQIDTVCTLANGCVFSRAILQ